MPCYQRLIGSRGGYCAHRKVAKRTERSKIMNALLISLLVFALILGGALVGVVVRPLLSAQHLHPDSKDVVKMATGLIGTLAALVLGLLIASAKSSFDQK